LISSPCALPFPSRAKGSFGALASADDQRAADAILGCSARPSSSHVASLSPGNEGIAAEPPVDVQRRAAAFDLDATIIAQATAGIVSGIWVIGPFFGAGEIGMLVARGWRGRGVGPALVASAIEWAEPPAA
jgi:GNAT superfamily N-acetyltransferase